MLYNKSVHMYIILFSFLFDKMHVILIYGMINNKSYPQRRKKIMYDDQKDWINKLIDD